MIKTYVINLPRSKERREDILSECAKFNIVPEIIGVDGKKFTETELRELVYDLDRNPLSRSEVGCALSHRTVYADMVKKDIPFALILEDDIVFKFDPRPILKEFSKHSSDEPIVYLLHKDESQHIVKSRINSILVGDFRFFQIFRGWSAYGYILSKKAAANILHYQTPVKVMADYWEMFEINDLIRYYVCEKEIVAHPSEHDSILEDDRNLTSRIVRKKYFQHLRRQVAFRTRVKNYFFLRRYVLRRSFLKLIGRWL